MVFLLRSLARLVALCLVAALALAGLALAIFSIRAHGTLSLPALAREVQLPGLSEAVGERLRRLEVEDRGVAWLTAAAGATAVGLGMLLLVGALARRREVLALLEENEHGRLAARRRPLAQAVGSLAEQVRGVTRARVDLDLHRRGHGGRADISATRSITATDAEVVERTSAAVAPLVRPFGLRTRVRARVGQRGSRVE